MLVLLELLFLQKNQLHFKFKKNHIFIMQSQIAVIMNTPAKTRYMLVHGRNLVKINEMIISEISIVKSSPRVLYQVPFKLSKNPNRNWKELLLNYWPLLCKQVENASNTTLWACHNRIIINNVPIELDKYVLNDLLSKAIDTINEWVVLNKQKLT